MIDLSKLTVAEAVELPEFKESLSQVMSEAWGAWQERHIAKRAGHAIRNLDNSNKWNTYRITEIYLGAISKTLDTNEYSGQVRQFVILLGDMALSRMINKLKEKGE